MTLLTIGDLTTDGKRKEKSVRRFLRYRKRLKRRKIKFEFITYDDLLLGRLPDITTKRLKIMFFFPYAYWNNNIERYDMDNRIYGDENFGRMYKSFFRKVKNILEKRYKAKDTSYVNPPAGCILDRNKKQTARILKKRGILTARTYKISSIAQLNKVLDRVGALYIKPVFGAMGKGMSFITKKECWTNFIYRKGKIISRPYDYNWKFVKISQKRRNGFLIKLMRKRFVFEEAVKLPLVKRRKFDIRLYTIYGEVPYFYARSAPQKSFVTNWSQGGRIERIGFLKRALPREKIEEIKGIARRSAETMGLNYAGTDIILDKGFDKVYFLETHSFPGYEKKFNLMKFLANRI